MKRLVSTLFASLIFVTPPLFAGGEGWVTDFEAAKAQAAQENKDLLIDFTGSDWCGWCKRLVAEVFSHDPFKEGVADSFVLVELDYPSKKVPQSDEIKQQNAELKTKYGIRGYPTIYLTDAQGRPYARTGYQAGGPEAYVAHLNEFRKQREKRDALFAKAESTEGLDKAGFLIKGLQLMPEEALDSFYADEMAVIKKLDPEDSLRFAYNMESTAMFVEMAQAVRGTFRSGDTDKALGMVDEFITDRKPEGELLQQALMQKAIAYAVGKKMDQALVAVDAVLAVKERGATATRALQMKLQILDEQRFAVLTEALETKAYDSVIKQVDEAIEGDIDKYPMERLVLLKAQALHGAGKTEDAMAVLDALDEPYRQIQAQIKELKHAWAKEQ